MDLEIIEIFLFYGWKIEIGKVEFAGDKIGNESVNDSIISRWIFRIYFDWIDCLIATDPNGFCLQSVSVLNLFRSNYEYFFLEFDIIFRFRISRKKKLIDADIDRFREKYSFKFYLIIICSVQTVPLIDARFQITRLAKGIVEKEHRRSINFWDLSKGHHRKTKANIFIGQRVTLFQKVHSTFRIRKDKKRPDYESRSRNLTEKQRDPDARVNRGIVEVWRARLEN